MNKKLDSRTARQLDRKTKKGPAVMWSCGLAVMFLISVFLVSNVPAHAFFFNPHYWIAGSISDPAGKGTGGRNVIFFENNDFLAGGIYVSAETGTGGYLLNALGVVPSIEPFAVVGNTYNTYIVNDNPNNPFEGYGADPVSVKLTGSGLDIANLELKKGAGIFWPGKPGGAPPVFDWIKFGDRIYQKNLVAKGEAFIVSATPKISAKVNSISALDTGSIKIVINEGGGATSVKDIKIQETNFTNKEFSAKGIEAKVITALTFSYDVPEQYKLGEGQNTVSFYATNAGGQTVEVATVKVMFGPVSIIGPVLTYPSPFSVTKDRLVTIQYTLSTDAAIDAFVFSPTGEIVKKFVNTKGLNGGAAGVNKITWDGIKPSGRAAGNAVYSGAIVDHGQGKILAKFKLTVVD